MGVLAETTVIAIMWYSSLRLSDVPDKCRYGNLHYFFASTTCQFELKYILNTIKLTFRVSPQKSWDHYLWTELSDIVPSIFSLLQLALLSKDGIVFSIANTLEGSQLYDSNDWQIQAHNKSSHQLSEQSKAESEPRRTWRQGRWKWEQAHGRHRGAKYLVDMAHRHVLEGASSFIYSQT